MYPKMLFFYLNNTYVKIKYKFTVEKIYVPQNLCENLNVHFFSLGCGKVKANG